MHVIDTADTFDLPEARVAVAGDWHGNEGWVRTLARSIGALAPEVTTVLQVGDWWMNPQAVDRAFSKTGVERVLVTLGNHEPWGKLTPLLEANPGKAIQVSKVTWILPRPFRFTAAGRTFLSLGGAASVDRMWRTEGKDWWADEAITDEHVEQAIAGGPADVMLTHESPNATPVRVISDILSSNPHGFPEFTLMESRDSRLRVDRVWNATRPSILFHGHMHEHGGGTAPDGRRVLSLGRDTFEGNLAFLNLDDLTVDAPSLREIRIA